MHVPTMLTLEAPKHLALKSTIRKPVVLAALCIQLESGEG